MRALDTWLLALCTKFAHAFQRLTGKTNFFLAKIGIMIATLHMVIAMIDFWYPILLQEKTSLSKFLFELVLLILTYSTVYDLDKADDEQQLSLERVMNPSLPNRYDRYGWVFRSLFLFFVVYDTGDVFFQSKHSSLSTLEMLHSVSLSFGITVFNYFVIVEPLRPGKSKIKQWIEKLSFGSRELASAGAKS